MKTKQGLAVFILVMTFAFIVPTMTAKSEDGILTQGKHALMLITTLRIDYLLPENAIEQDAANILAVLGIYPCNKVWEVDKELSDEDYCCILGEEPGCDVFLSENELREKIFDAYPELFWVGTEPRQPVSPFVP
ncbi:hypothetical protein ACFLU6_01725 [Acidobacteriota bacterium]